MDKRALLKKLEDFFSIEELTDGFGSQGAAISWSNKVAPLLKLVNPQYFAVFATNAQLINNPNLTTYTIIPAFNVMKSQLEMAIEELKLKIELEEGLKEQIYFPEHSHLDIQKIVAKVIRQATASLSIYDPYMDEKIVEELTEVVAPCIRLLTDKPKGLFHQRLIALRQQFSTKIIEAKSSGISHDRFFVIDEDQVWTLGASYNQAGGKATLLSKVMVEAEKEKIKNSFESWWSSARVI